MRFEPEAEKGPRRLMVKREMEPATTLERIEEARLSEAKLASYAGNYWSEELRANYRIRMKDGKLRLED
jgi:hypothetical protein